MRDIFCPEAPPLLLKTLCRLTVYLSSCAKNFDRSGTVVIRMNSAFILKKKKIEKGNKDSH